MAVRAVASGSNRQLTRTYGKWTVRSLLAFVHVLDGRMWQSEVGQPEKAGAENWSFILLGEAERTRDEVLVRGQITATISQELVTQELVKGIGDRLFFERNW